MRSAADRQIFIVDDDDDIRFTLRLVLEDEGYRVVEAHDGREALERLRAGAPPLAILLDLSMPGMNGYQFIEESRRDAVLGAVPVIVLSAADRLEEKVAPLGVAGCLKKPVDLDRLLSSLAQLAA